MVFPWIQAVFPVQADLYDESDDAQLSDIQFLAVKEFGGKLRENTSDPAKTTTGDLATLTASTGKDMYLANAKISVKGTSTTGAISVCKVELKINGVVHETTEMKLSSSTAGVFNDSNYEFRTTGVKVLAGEIIKLEVITATLVSIEGVVTCFEETTGATPRLPALQISGGTGATVNGDVAFLAKKTFDGKLVTNTGQQADGGTGNTATLTASTGKDLYLVKAQATVRVDVPTNIILGEVTLVVNSVIKDRWEFAILASNETAVVMQTHDFAVQGVKVLAGETIVLDVVSSNVDFDISGTLVGFEENTGDPPV